nr:hypothetical protein [Pandoravirus aubagnensis]
MRLLCTCSFFFSLARFCGVGGRIRCTRQAQGTAIPLGEKKQEEEEKNIEERHKVRKEQEKRKKEAVCAPHVHMGAGGKSQHAPKKGGLCSLVQLIVTALMATPH